MKKIYILDGLDCAVCAEKIRNKVSKIDTVESAEINMFTKKLTLTIPETDNTNELYTKKIKHIVKEIEPNVNVFNEDDALLENDKSYIFEIIKMIFSGFLLLIALIAPISFTYKTIITLISYLIIGHNILFHAIKNIFKGDFLDENFLMSIASLGAFIIGEHEEAVGVMLFYNIGDFLNNLAIKKSRKSISKLMDLRPDYVNIMKNGNLIKVSPNKITKGDTIIVKTGERIPIDGIVAKGNSSLNTLAITGESVPKDVNEGDTVLSGCINLQGILEIKTTTDFNNSTVSKILELTENAQNKKAKTENFITKFAKVYTPIIVIFALILAIIPSIITKEPSIWIYRALTFLVVSCPCALVISIPLTYFSGIGSASTKGILVKGGAALDILTKCDTLVFDKTGTLTKGILSVSKINPVNISSEQLLEYAAYAEAYSTHPIGIGIRTAYNKPIALNDVTCTEIAGKGIYAKYKSKNIICGKAEFLNENNIKISENDDITTVYIAVNGQYVGNISLLDKPKNNIKEFLQNVRHIGIKQTVMLSGDNIKAAKFIADKVGIDNVKSELLPADKVNELEKLISNGHKTVYTGDGINDAPVLARADVGIAMGGLGSDAAIEAADIVIMNDDVTKITDILLIAIKTKNIVYQNIFFSLGIKFLILGLSAIGMTNMWFAVFADVGVTFLAILNSLRTRIIKT